MKRFNQAMVVIGCRGLHALRSGAGIREPGARGRPRKALGLRGQRRVGRSREVGHARRRCDVLDGQTAGAHQPERRRGDTAGSPESGVRIQAVEPLDDQQRPHGTDDIRRRAPPSAAWEARTHGRSHNSTSMPRASTPWTASRTRSKCTSFTSTPPGNRPPSWQSSFGPARRTLRSRRRSRACPPRKATRWLRRRNHRCRRVAAGRQDLLHLRGLADHAALHRGHHLVRAEDADRDVTRADRRVHEARAPRAQQPADPESRWPRRADRFHAGQVALPTTG